MVLLTESMAPPHRNIHSISNESFHPAIEIYESRKNDYLFSKYMNMILSFDSQFTGFQEALHVLKKYSDNIEKEW